MKPEATTDKYSAGRTGEPSDTKNEAILASSPSNADEAIVNEPIEDPAVAESKDESIMIYSASLRKFLREV